MQKIAFLGCSRGLGRAVLQIWDKNCDVTLVSRKVELLQSIAREFAKGQIRQCDLTLEQNINDLIELLIQNKVQNIFYFAGGGPHGFFEEKKWKDHEWAFKINFLTPARILHSLMGEKFLKKFVIVGSQIAEDTEEPMGTSYAASKKAIKGLVESINARQEELSFKLVLFSPGYMDTDMLPANAEPRKQGLARDVNLVAKEFMELVAGLN